MIKKLYFKLKHRVPYWMRIKWFIQRGRKGYSDSDLYSLDSYVCSMMPGALRLLSKRTHGYPSKFQNAESWKNVLETMAVGFEAGGEIICEKYLDSYTLKEIKEGVADNDLNKIREDLYAKFDLALCLFHKHFFDLWD